MIKNCSEENGFLKGLNSTDLINHKERKENRESWKKSKSN
jgi:hypothetical protein